MFPIAHAGLPLAPFLFSRRMPKGWWLIVVGAVLPDIIDKPLGHVILPENNGRVFAHTLLLSALLLAIGTKWRPALLLSYGTLTHLLLDSMYMDPQSVMWPLMGGFRSTDFSYIGWLEALKDPAVILGEIMGAASITAFVWRFRRNTKTIYNKMS
ncbi:MAG: metal-dependent hydrolase [Candidatus Thermoplasmatota archaeon]|nr:metal-dependent hydrolase [Candidatus Thermoplasmatota archaeon]